MEIRQCGGRGLAKKREVVFLRGVETPMHTMNKPDLVIWNTKGKTGNIVEFSCPADINTTKKEEEKLSAYVYTTNTKSSNNASKLSL